jgi:hypothetical protein
MKIGILAAALLLTATGATAAAPGDDAAEPATTAANAEPAAGAAAETGAEAQDERKICRTERSTGSLTRRTRVCMTAAQWRDINTRTYKGVSEMQGQGSGGQVVQNNPGPGG